MALHLDSLYISGFRGIPKLEIPRLGRVTLLAGKNGVGKTAALDAVQVYAARSGYFALARILRNHEELRRTTDDRGIEVMTPDWNALFYGRDMWQEPGIRIGPCDACRQIGVRAVWVDSEQMKLQSPFAPPASNILAWEVVYGNQQWNIPVEYPIPNLPGRRVRPEVLELPSEIGCNRLGPGLPGQSALASFWDDAVIRNEQSLATDALNLMLDAPAEWVAAVGDATPGGSGGGRRIMAKIAGDAVPVPLQSLGDGATRIFGATLALASSRDGFLLIDEAENGMHHSMQQDFWKLVLLAAEKYSVQVLATTHSWDCVVGFGKAASSLPDIAGMLYRIQRNGQRLRAVEYPESELMMAAKYGIEVR